jgi:MFS family permease
VSISPIFLEKRDITVDFYITCEGSCLYLGFSGRSKFDKGNLAAALLLIGTLSWFFIFIFNMTNIFVDLTHNTDDWAGYIGNSLVYGFGIFWAIAASLIGRTVNRRKLWFTSIILGIFSTAALAFVEGPILTSIVCSLMGMSLGLGLPSSMALVAGRTIVENRGRTSGMIILSTFIIAFGSLGIYWVLGLGLLSIIPILIVVRLISLFGLAIDKLNKPLTITEKIHLPTGTYREFLFYLAPWLMFTVASSLLKSLIEASDLETEVFLGDYLRYVFIAVFGLAAGFISDRFGRKLPIYFGSATLAIGYLLLGYNINELSVNIYYILSGITWGLFFVVFLAIPGDISTPDLREKFYALGYIFPLTGLFALSAIPIPQIGDILPPEIIAQILGVCVFLSMYPVFRAKETLPEKKKRDRQMKEYMEKLGKTLQETDYDE